MSCNHLFCITFAAGLSIFSAAFAQDPDIPVTPTPPVTPEVERGASQSNEVLVAELRNKASYAHGMQFGRSLLKQNEFDPEVFLQAVSDIMNQRPLKLTPEEAREAFYAYRDVLEQKAKSELVTVMKKNVAVGEAFLEKNAEKDDVVVLPSGLQYKVLVAGSGIKPRLTDTVLAHYTGSLVDGREFDSTRGKAPAEFPLTDVIEGWKEGLQLMSVGSRYMLYVPQNLAYGPRHKGELITPGSTLVFEVELIGIK